MLRIEGQKQMDVKKQLKKINGFMQDIEQCAKEHIKDEEDILQVCGAMMAVTRNMYVEAIGYEDTQKVFEAILQSFDWQQEMELAIKLAEKPTIH
jgi:transcriptional regulator